MNERSKRGRVGAGEAGFTLVELLVVVVIIGVLAAISLPKLFSAIDAAHEGVTMGRLGAIRDTLTIWWVDHGGAKDEYERFPKQLVAITWGDRYFSSDGEGDNGLPGEEVGDGPKAGDQITDWCEVGHDYCNNRTVQGGGEKGGWNFCSPGGAFSPTAPSKGTVWVDEDGIGTGQIPYNEY